MEEKSYFYAKEHKGKVVYVTDWSNIEDESQMINRIWETTHLLENLASNELLELVIFRKSVITKNVLLEMQKAAKVSRPYNLKKAGLTDLSPTRLYILKTINLFSRDKIEAFDNEQEALDWLTS